MAVTAAICNSFKAEILMPAAGVHLSGDTYMIALYGVGATLNKSTAVYSATGEVGNSGTYAAGGQALVGFAAAFDGDTYTIDWSTNPLWTGATIAAIGALIYNSSKTNKAVAVLDFGGTITSTNGNFLVTLPAPAAATAVVRIT
jgi:hypothetical protein